MFLREEVEYCWAFLVGFGKFIFQKIVTNKLFGWDFCVVQQHTINPHQDWNVKLYKKVHFDIIGWSIWDAKNFTYLELAQNWNPQTYFEKF